MKLFLIFLSLCICITGVQSHSFITRPDAYNRRFQIRDCRGAECNQACPKVEKLRNTQQRPAARWRRGQRTRVVWAKNNHQHGFIRLALVPVGKMMDRAAHAKLAFYYGCFDQGPVKCTTREMCGADHRRTALSRQINVPRHVRNGDYVLGFVWYGGVRTPLSRREFFTEYWSCSYVRIEGNEPVAWSYQPQFYTGTPYFASRGQVSKNVQRGKCFTAAGATEPGACGKRTCKGPGVWARPKGFIGGQKPRRILARDV